MKLFLLFVACSICSSLGFTIDCHLNNTFLFDGLDRAYTCGVKHLITNEINRNVSRVNTEHQRGKTNDDVSTIQIFEKKMEYFPRGFTSFFKNIVAFHAGMNGLKYLEKSDLKDFVKLKFLYLYKNQLETLPSDLFIHNPALEYISFFDNRLTNIGSKTLMPLQSLKIAFFDKNICIDKQATTYEGLLELKLEIAQQCIETTNEDLMSMLKLNQMRMMKLETKVSLLSEQLASVIELLKASNKVVE